MNTSFARPWLRAEGFAVLVAAACAYQLAGLPWFWFALLFLAPDLSMLGYLAGVRVGAVAYNLGHLYALALPAALIGLADNRRALLGVGLIWCAHIGFDRLLGYGLKSPEGFKLTHLGRLGPGRNQTD